MKVRQSNGFKGYNSKTVNQRHRSTLGPAFVSLVVNDHNCKFELDTGADSTIISVNDWKKLGSQNIHRSDLKLECYM